MIDKRFGKKINEKRKELNIKVDDLAYQCGVHCGYMRQILLGKVPSIQILVIIWQN